MRNAIKFIKENLKEELVGVEIGVYEGGNATDILQNLSIKKLFLIDLYAVYDDYPEQPVPLKEAEDIARKRLAEWLAKHKGKVFWIKKKSADAVNDVPNNLDFVYIDGNHDYEYVKQDIENYYLKLKAGGVLAGHDYKGRPYEPGVDKAVDEFIKKKGLRLYTGKDSDWWVVKNGNSK